MEAELERQGERGRRYGRQAGRQGFQILKACALFRQLLTSIAG